MRMATSIRGDQQGSAHEVQCANTVPLNLKRLTGVLLKQLAGAMEVPTSASTEDPNNKALIPEPHSF